MGRRVPSRRSILDEATSVMIATGKRPRAGSWGGHGVAYRLRPAGCAGGPGALIRCSGLAGPATGPLACHWAGAGAALRDIFGLMFANSVSVAVDADKLTVFAQTNNPAYSSLSGYIVSKRRYRPQRRRCFNVPAPLLSLTSGAGLNEDSMKLPSVISSAD